MTDRPRRFFSKVIAGVLALMLVSIDLLGLGSGWSAAADTARSIALSGTVAADQSVALDPKIPPEAQQLLDAIKGH